MTEEVKNEKIFCMLSALMLTISALAGCQAGSSSVQNKISDVLGINVSDGEEIQGSDSHGGFHGDGMKDVVLSFSDDLSGQIVGSDGWKPLPLSQNLTALVYGIRWESDDATYQVGPYLTDDNNNPVIPQIENGYYYFLDRHSKSVDSYDDSDVLERHSYNFTIAIYDSNTDTLYYAEYDT